MKFRQLSRRRALVLLVGPVAAGLCLVSALLYMLYPEQDVLAEARTAPEDPKGPATPEDPKGPVRPEDPKGLVRS